MTRTAPALALMLMAARVMAASSPAPIDYTVRFPDARHHYVDIEARVPPVAGSSVELMMPVWTPGSYLVREYERNVEQLRARSSDGRELSVMKTRKNRWRIEAHGGPFVLSYRVYAREMGVRQDWVDDEFALLNGAATFMTIADSEPRAHDVHLELPSGWATSVTPLPPSGDGRPNSYRAEDFDALVDSPIVAGNPDIRTFEVDGKRHDLVTIGGDKVWDTARAVQDVEKIVREDLKLWGFLPYPRYVFFNIVGAAGGGLEHKNSTVMMSSRWGTRTRRGYESWLGLVSHEYFHAWNVKRLRPIELGPFDYENEVYTRGLWVAEGFTDYYGPTVLARAGLVSRDATLEQFSRMIAYVRTTPGRLVQTTESASYDAWIKEYRHDENSVNATISYYMKGAAIAFLLNARVLAATDGSRSLDDAMRLAYQRFSGAHGYTEAQFMQTVQEIAGADLSAFFHSALQTNDELDFSQAFEWLGLRFEAPERPAASGQTGGWLGLGLRTDRDRLFVSEVRRGTPGYDAQFSVDDEIVAVDNYRVDAAGWNDRLEKYRPGDRVQVLVARRERLVSLDVTFGEETNGRWRIEVKPDATTVQKAHLEKWLGSGTNDVSLKSRF